jgi:hypothetical protein
MLLLAIIWFPLIDVLDLVLMQGSGIGLIWSISVCGHFGRGGISHDAPPTARAPRSAVVSRHNHGWLRAHVALEHPNSLCRPTHTTTTL